MPIAYRSSHTGNFSVSVSANRNMGSGIYNSYGDTVLVSDSTISSNSASGYTSIGGIDNDGKLTVSSSTISGNNAGSRFGLGSGIYGSTTVNNSTISNNSVIGVNSSVGGGIYNSYSSNLTLVFSTLIQNLAANGAGVYQDNVPPFSSALPGSAHIADFPISRLSVPSEMNDQEKERINRLLHLLPQSLWVEQRLHEIIQDYLSNPSSKGINNLASIDTKKNTLLPDSQYSFGFSTPADLALPVVAAFRVFLDKQYNWVLPFDEFSDSLIQHLWNKHFLDYLKLEKAAGNSIGAKISRNNEVWENWKPNFFNCQVW